MRLAGFEFCFDGKKVPETNILVHLLTCVFILKDSENFVLANREGSKGKILTPKHPIKASTSCVNFLKIIDW